jgi:alkanesulfonate monooxygenase SsuD/methylene tetrahydromethanopterin reductase-like flavin-dependent oxidoreductase (luciferase family)
MDIGIFVNPLYEDGNTDPQEKFHESLTRIRQAEEWGFASAWITEHHFLRYSRPSSPVLLAAAAAQTERIRLGTGVVVLPFHDPVRLAEDLATLDHISGGRVDVGIGRGLFPAEFDGFAIELEESKPRFDEALEVLLKAWTSDEPFSYRGTYNKYEDIVVYPRPLQRPHPPLCSPCVSPGSFERAVSRGFNGLVGAYMTPIETLKETAFGPWEAAKKEFNAPHLRNLHNEIVYVAETREQAYKEAERPIMEYVRAAGQIWGDPNDPRWANELGPVWQQMVSFFQTVTWDEVFEKLVIAGDPDFVTERFLEFSECGVDELLVYPCDFDFDQTTRSLRLIAEEVAPAVGRALANKQDVGVTSD